MKSTFKLFGIIALLAVIGFGFASCGDDGGEPAGSTEPPQTAMYSGEAADGSKYTLKVIEKTGRYAAQDGDSYILYTVDKNGETKTSSGTVTTMGTTLTLKPANITISFTITINDTGITSITGTITFDDKTEVPAPGPVEPLPDVPENWPVAARWEIYNLNGWTFESVNPPNYVKNTATMNYSVDKDGVCAITIGGKAMPPLNENGGTDGNTQYWYSIWFSAAAYRYTIIGGKSCTFTFEAWTDGPDRALSVEWYQDTSIDDYRQTEYEPPEDGSSIQLPSFKITSERKTYTITDSLLPESVPWNLMFYCANQLGTFYVKIISIDFSDPLPDVPENWPEAKRWWIWNEDTPVNTTTLNYTVDKDGVCAITVGGTAVPPLNENGGTDGNVKYWNSIYKTQANYKYSIIAGKSYTYTFEAWTDGPDRALNILWYNDFVDGIYQQTAYAPEDGEDWETSTCPPVFKITSERKTYTLTSDGPLPKSLPESQSSIYFQCANQTGTFYVKMLSIESF
jgi:hypothetical protein